MWKAGTIPILGWGDAILSCVDLADATNADPPVIRYEPNMPEAGTHSYLKGEAFRGAGLIPEADSVSAWLIDWLAGKALFKCPYQRKESIEG